MIFDPKEFLEFSKDLLSQYSATDPHEQAILRSILSRTYYAAHLKAVEKLSDEGIVFQEDGTDHGLAIRELRLLYCRGTDANKKRAHKRLLQLMERRKKADYNIGWTATERACKTSIQMASELFSALA